MIDILQTKNDEQIDFLKSIFNSIKSPPSLKKIRTNKWKNFLEYGLPNNKIENYKYSNISILFERFFHLKNKFNKCYLNIREDENYINLTLKNSKNFLIDKYQSMVSIKKTSTLSTEFNEILEKASNNILEILLDSLSEDFILIDVPKNTFLKKPIFINYDLDKEHINPINIIINIGENSQIKILFSQSSNNHISKLVYNNTKINVADNSNVALNILQSNNEYVINNLNIELTKNVKFTSNIFTTKNNYIRNNFLCSINGENSDASFYGLNYLIQSNQTDNFLDIKHLKAHSTSNQLFKGVIKDSSSIFNGKIYVDKIAQKTNAYQLNNNIVLSSKGKVRTRPQLEIYADDVKCSHGATIGKLDKDHLMYLTMRGIDNDTAIEILINAFMEGLINKVEDTNFKKTIKKNFQNEKI